jgi:Methyltransferase domain
MTRPIQKLLSIFITATAPSEFDEAPSRLGDKHEAAFPCEIRSYQEYETGYRDLAVALDRAETTPRPGELERIRELVARRSNPAGSLGLADCLFLAAFASIIRPRRIVEIGTGSGFSSALLASVMHLQRPHLRAPCLDTFDIHTTYFGDAKLPVGFEIPKLISEFAELVRVHAPGESTLIGKLVEKDELELAFIDGNHQHPCVLLDLLRIAPYVRSDSWILLHDIRLGTMVEESRNAGAPLPFEAVFGAEWLFNDWPWSKIDGGNIGAIQLPEQKKALRGFAKKLMKRPLEVCEQSYHRMHCEVNEAGRACGR